MLLRSSCLVVLDVFAGFGPGVRAVAVGAGFRVSGKALAAGVSGVGLGATATDVVGTGGRSFRPGGKGRPSSPLAAAAAAGGPCADDRFM